MKRRFKNIIVLAIFLVLLLKNTSAQSPLDKYIKQGLENNQELILKQTQIQLAEQDHKVARGNYMPNIYFDASYIWAQGGRTIDVPAGDLVNPAYQGLNQILGSNAYPTDIENVSEQLLPHDFHETKIRLIQPLFNMDIYYNQQIAKNNITLQEAKVKAYENQLKKQIKVSYYQLLSFKDKLNIQNESLELLNKLLTLNKSLVSNQKRTKEVIYSTQAEIDKLQSEITDTKNKLDIASKYFNYLIGKDLNDEIELEASSKDEIFKTNVKDSIVHVGLENREELNQLDLARKSYDLKTKMRKQYWLPEVNLIGDVGYQGFEYKFNQDQDFWFLRVGLTWPIFQGFKNQAATQKTQIQVDQINIQTKQLQEKISLEIQRAHSNYITAIEQYKAANSELTNSEEFYKIINNKYKEGLVIPLELKQARNNLIQTKLKKSIAKYSVKIALAELEATVNQSL